MRLKKWRNPRTNEILIFVNDCDAGENIAIVDDGSNGWKVTKQNATLPDDVATEVTEGVEDITGILPEDGFKALCKEVDW